MSNNHEKSQSPNRLEQHKTLYYSNLDFAFATFFINTMTKTFMAGLIGFFKGSEIWVNAAFAIPNLVGLIQVPGSILAKSYPGYKGIVFWGQFAWRVLHIPIIFLPMAPIPADYKIAIILSCMACGAVGFHLSTPILYEWLSIIVPVKSRGWFFSRRNALAAGFAALLGVVVGLVFDNYRSAHEEAIGFTLVFAFVVVASLLGMLSYSKMKDLPRVTAPRENFRQSMLALQTPLQDKNFRRVLTYIAMFSVALTLHGNLFFTFGIKQLKIPYALLQATVITEAAGFLLSAKIWGYLVDKYGNKPILAIIAVGLFLSPMPWFFCQPGNNVLNGTLLLIGYVFSGAIWGGAQTCQLNLVISCSKPETRTSSIALGLAVQFLLGAVAPIVGGLLIHQLLLRTDPVQAYKLFFFIAMLVRLSTLLFVSRFKEEGSTNIGSALKQIKSFSGRGLKTFKKLSSSVDSEDRADALADVKRSHLTLVTDEVIKALDDPSPMVRQQAVVTLGSIGTADDVPSVISYIQKHPNFLNADVVMTLGKLHSPLASSLLLDLLNHPKPSIQLASAKSLGLIQDPETVNPMILHALGTTTSDLKAMLLEALSRILVEGESYDQAGLLNLVRVGVEDPDPGLRVAASHLVAQLNTTSVVPDLVRSLDLYQDEASCEVAYALGLLANKDLEVIRKILVHGQKLAQHVSQKRCLMAVASILGVESEFYRLILLDGMTLETAVIELLGAKMKRSKRLREAVDLYFAKNEREAVKKLIVYSKECRSEIQLLHEDFLPSSFLLACCLVVV